MKKSSKFWFHVWSGVLTPEHQKRLGLAVWLYLFLLSKVDRGTGEIFITRTQICKEMECSIYQVKWRMAILRAQGYVTSKNVGNCTHIKITKWRSINGVKESWGKKAKRERLAKEKEND